MSTNANKTKDSLKMIEKKPLTFTCPQCGGNRIYRVMRSTTWDMDEIGEVFADGQVIYDYHDMNEDLVMCFCCADCEYELVSGSMYEATDAKLVKWLIENCEQNDR